MTQTNTLPIAIRHDEVAAFCRRWGIVQLALFGSALRSDFNEAARLVSKE